MGGQPLTLRAVSGPVRDRRREVVHRRTAPTGNSCGWLGLAPGIDSESVTASCDLGVLRVVMPIEQPAARKDPPEAACFLTLGTQPCACSDPGALFDEPLNVSHSTRKEQSSWPRQ